MSSLLRVAVLYGGRSGEHEVSLQSAASVVRNLDPQRFAVIPVGIDKQGQWRLHDAASAGVGEKSLCISPSAPVVVLAAAPGQSKLVELGNGKATAVDVIFPVLHGPLCEDGTLQGLLDLAEIPYVGCGVLASAVGMDKDIAKRLAQAAGIPVVPWITLRRSTYTPADHARIASEIGFPCFVKPANLGSSVGVAKVKNAAELPKAIEAALSYDLKVLVEKAIDAREIEVAVLEPLDDKAPPMTTVPGEIQPTHEFYSYEAKYLDENGAALMIPARLEAAQQQMVRRVAAEAFTALECEGLSRVDLFLDRRDGQFYFNEVNTLPGFTQISMYPKLWEATGIGYKQLLTHLVDLAIARHRRKAALCRDFHA